MGVTEVLDKEIIHYLPHLSTQQKEVVLSVVKTFAGEETWWNEKTFIAEMNRRFTELENGKIKGYTLEEMEARAREKYKNHRQGTNRSC